MTDKKLEDFEPIPDIIFVNQRGKFPLDVMDGLEEILDCDTTTFIKTLKDAAQYDEVTPILMGGLKAPFTMASYCSDAPEAKISLPTALPAPKTPRR